MVAGMGPGTVTVTAQMVASVVEVVVAAGGRVEEGAALCVVESMKMEIPLVAPASGTVRELRVACGDTLAEGDVVAVLDTA